RDHRRDPRDERERHDQPRLAHRNRDRERHREREQPRRAQERELADPTIYDRGVSCCQLTGRAQREDAHWRVDLRSHGHPPGEEEKPYRSMSFSAAQLATTPSTGALGVCASSCTSRSAEVSRVCPIRATITIPSTSPSSGITSLTSSGDDASTRR